MASETECILCQHSVLGQKLQFQSLHHLQKPQFNAYSQLLHVRNVGNQGVKC